MIQIGHRYDLKIIKIVDFGVYVDAEELGKILVPNKHLPKDAELGDIINVFLYLDSDDRPIATTQKPRAEVGQFAYLKVVATSPIGAFLDWGLDKDVLVPFSEQHRKMEEDRSYLVYLYLDKVDERITASSKIDKFIDDDAPHDFKEKQAVDLIVANTTDLGWRAIINHSHWGVLYTNEVHQTLSFGQYKKGFIKRIREDGKIDLSLQGGQETRDKYAKIILIHLNKHDGFAAVHDKSDPQLIADIFGMSKGAFKKAIGGLYKQRIIRIEKDGIHLISSE